MPKNMSNKETTRPKKSKDLNHSFHIFPTPSQEPGGQKSRGRSPRGWCRHYPPEHCSHLRQKEPPNSPSGTPWPSMHREGGQATSRDARRGTQGPTRNCSSGGSNNLTDPEGVRSRPPAMSEKGSSRWFMKPQVVVRAHRGCTHSTIPHTPLLRSPAAKNPAYKQHG